MLTKAFWRITPSIGVQHTNSFSLFYKRTYASGSLYATHNMGNSLGVSVNPSVLFILTLFGNKRSALTHTQGTLWCTFGSDSLFLFPQRESTIHYFSFWFKETRIFWNSFFIIQKRKDFSIIGVTSWICHWKQISFVECFVICFLFVPLLCTDPS